jgi:hypothetical protein
MDHNLYGMQNDDKAFARASPWAGWNFGAWQSRGHDAHSAMVAEPSGILFVNEHEYPMQCEAMDLRLLPRSPAAHAGVSIGGFADDRNGKKRDIAAPWDIGAFALVSGSTDTAASTATRRNPKE